MTTLNQSGETETINVVVVIKMLTKFGGKKLDKAII